MSEWVDDEDAVHDGWEYVGSLSGPYDELKGFYCPDDGKFYVDRYHWNREGDERYYDGYDEYPPRVIWNSFSFKYERERLMEIAEKYGVSYGDVKNGFKVWTRAVGIRKLTDQAEGGTVIFHAVRDDEVYLILETETGHTFLVSDKDRIYRRNVKDIGLEPFDFFKKKGEDFMTYYFLDPESLTVYLTNDKMLEKGDLVSVGSGAASDDIMPDGRIVTGYYADEKGAPAITISKENESGDDYETVGWTGKSHECVSVHVSSGGDIWINLAEDEGKLRVFRNGEGSPEIVETDDKDFDAFGLSDDGTKLLVCHTKYDEPTELYVMELSDGRFTSKKAVELKNADEIGDVTFYRGTAACRLGDSIHVIDISCL